MNHYIYIKNAAGVTGSVPESDHSEALAESTQALNRDEFCWGIVNDSIITSSAEGSLDELVTFVVEHELPIVFIVPGEKVVVRHTDYDVKQKRHFLKMLPYAIEDNAVTDVDDLHFAVGNKQADYASIAYIDNEWLSQQWSILVDNSIVVDKCIADFQQLVLPNLGVTKAQCVCWFSDDGLKIHTDDGRGFSSAHAISEILLTEFLSVWAETPRLSEQNLEEQDEGDSVGQHNADYTIDIYIDSSCDVERIHTFFKMFPKDVFDIRYHEETPLLSASNPQSIDFCIGEYRKKDSPMKQVKEYRLVAIIGLLALAAFIFVNVFDIYHMRQENLLKEAKIEQEFRKEIPRGVVNDPVRQLTAKLGDQSDVIINSSDVVFLLNEVAPVVNQLNVDLSTVNYSHQDQSMRIGIQVQSFGVIDQLKTQLINKGLDTELLSSNAVDDVFQARLRIAKEAR